MTVNISGVSVSYYDNSRSERHPCLRILPAQIYALETTSRAARAAFESAQVAGNDIQYTVEQAKPGSAAPRLLTLTRALRPGLARDAKVHANRSRRPVPSVIDAPMPPLLDYNLNMNASMPKVEIHSTLEGDCQYAVNHLLQHGSLVATA